MEVSKSKFLTMLIATLVVVGIVVGGILISNCNINKSNISIYINEQLIMSTNVKNGKELNLDELKIEGYKIIGIYDNAELKGDKLTGKITINKDTSLYLNAERLYRIILPTNTSSTSIYGSPGDVIKMPTENLPSKEHAKLLGFAIKDNIIVLSPTIDYTIKEEDFTNFSVNFKAVWENAKTIVLKNGDKQSIEYLYAGEELTLPYLFKEGKYISSWTSNNGTIYDTNDKITILDNMTLTAIWSPCKYTLTFNSNGGSTLEDMEVTYGSTIVLPTPTKADAAFLHWVMTMSNGTKVNVSGSIQVPDLGENGIKTLTAGYTTI